MTELLLRSLATFLRINIFPCRTTARACYSYQMKADCNKDQAYTEYHIDTVKHRCLYKDKVLMIDSRLPGLGMETGIWDVLT